MNILGAENIKALSSANITNHQPALRQPLATFALVSPATAGLVDVELLVQLPGHELGHGDDLVGRLEGVRHADYVGVRRESPLQSEGKN